MVTGSGKKGPRGIDEGFCLSYYHLSYRRKFVRTVWMMLFSPILLFLPLPDPAMWFAAVILLGILQAVYNYRKWQTEEKP
jgi:hypothetical protein